jgi:hypothetical protein
MSGFPLFDTPSLSTTYAMKVRLYQKILAESLTLWPKNACSYATYAYTQRTPINKSKPPAPSFARLLPLKGFSRDIALPIGATNADHTSQKFTQLKGLLGALHIDIGIRKRREWWYGVMSVQ